MAHDQVHFEPNKEFYKFEGGIKKMSIVFIILGVLGAIGAFFSNDTNHHSRFWSNLLLNTYYFNGMAIAAVFFISAHMIGYGGYISSMKRIFESFGNFVYVTGFFFILIILGLWFDWHNLYEHWTHAPATDTIVGDKKAFLNKGMFTFLSLLFFALWIIAIRMIRKHSLSSDHAVDEVAYNQKSKYIAAFYIVIFGVSSSVFSWLAVMSLDPHWYSTMFGWYNFGSHMCGFLAFAILIITILKSKGLLSFVNDSHMHNIVLFLFGFSVFYTYTWYDQFMLQWYANIPEDTMYFVKRFRIPLFKFLFFFTFVINFVFPFLFLLRRNAKRNPWIYGIASAILIVGHYFDFYMMVMLEPNAPSHHAAEAAEPAHHSNAIKLENKLLAEAHTAAPSHATAVVDSIMPAAVEVLTHTDKHESTEHAATDITLANHETGSQHAVHAHKKTMHAPHGGGGDEHMATLGLYEFMMFFGFIGLFFFTILTTLSKERLVPIKTPFLDESLHYNF
jgi:hypothetical protein